MKAYGTKKDFNETCDYVVKAGYTGVKTKNSKNRVRRTLKKRARKFNKLF